MKAGKWERKAFAGVELHGKRIGVVGLGRIGREVAARCPKLGMEVVGFDPFVSPAVAETQGVPPAAARGAAARRATSSRCTPRSRRETRHLIGKEALAKVKPGVRIVNAARGELIDEAALLEALESGRVAAAALDVHAQEPPQDWRLARHPRVVATPHIGAATAEAQERVGTDIAVQVRDYLKGGVIQHAVNFFSLSRRRLRPGQAGHRPGASGWACSWARSAPGPSSASRSASTATSASSTPSPSWPRRCWGSCGASVPTASRW